MVRNNIKILYGIIFSCIIFIIGKKKNKDKNVFLFSFPRSGSTWIQNILSSNNSSIIFEPFHIYKDSKIKKFSKYNKLFLVEENTKKFKIVFDKIMSGRHLTRWSSSYSSLSSFLKCDHFVIKILRGNLSLKWFHNNYPNNKKIILFRHPCAVISSMKRSPGGWNTYSPEYIKGLSSLKFGETYFNLIEKYNEQIYLMLFQWCIEMKSLTNEFEESKELVLFYEDIFEKPEKELDKIFMFLKTDIPNNIKEKHKEKSQTTNDISSLNENKPLESWKKSFKEEELNIFQIILNEFQIDIYNTSSFYPIKING